MASDDDDEDRVYNADTYTEGELLEFLDLSPSATDRELEAKIVQMINQYPETRIQTFFKDVYRRFFDVDLLEEDEDEDKEQEEEEIQEGMENRSITVLQDKKTTKEQVKNVEKTVVSKAKAALTASDEMYGKVDPRLMQSVVLTKGLDYVADPKGLNPTLNNTIQRVLIIDSRCRDRTIYKSSTDFTLNLSENLKHVLALNFYYVNVPYTWYTISKAYGANLIFLNGNPPGISSVDSALRISIEPGNYTTPEALVKAVDGAIKTLAAVRTDISFGNSGVTLTSNTAGSGKATFTWDIQNRLGDANYSLVFPFWTSPADHTTTTLNNGTTEVWMSQISIPGFLGFLQNNTYALSSVVSDFEHAYVVGDIDLDNSLFMVDTTNNTFFIYNHAPGATVNPLDATTYYDKIQVTIPTGQANRADLMKKVNTALVAIPALDPVRSSLTFEQATFTNEEELDYVQRFRLTIQLNRFQTKNHVGQCQTIIFPNESSRLAPVWTGSTSAFYFLENTLLRLNSTLAEVGYGNGNTLLSSSAFYTYASEALTLNFKCKKYATEAINALNSFTVTVPGKDNYTLASHLTAINSSLESELVANHFSVPAACRFFYYDYLGTGSNSNSVTFESSVYAELGFQESFDYQHFTVNARGSILCTYFGFPETMDFTANTTGNPNQPNVYETEFFLNPDGYEVNNGNRQVIISSKTGDESPITFYLPYCPKQKTTLKNDAWYRFPDLTSLQEAINNSQYGFSQYQNKESVYQEAPNTGTVPLTTKIPEKSQFLFGLNLSQCKIEFTNVTATKAKCKLTWNISNSLSEQDYRVELSGSSWSLLGFASSSARSFVLSDLTWSPVGSTMATIFGDHDVETSTISIADSTSPNIRVQNNQLYVQPKENAESLSSTADKMTVAIAPGLYNRFSLVRALNAALAQNEVTRGTQFVWCGQDLENVRIDWNINKVYRAEDYTLTFFDLYEFGHCEPHTTGNSSLTAIRWDQTLGWLLGYRSLTTYNMSESVATSSDPDIGYSTTNVYTVTSNRVVSIEGDTPVNVYLYNQLHVVLDDYTGNHMNDGIVTVAPPNAETTLPSYANRAQQRCDVQPVVQGSGGKSVPGFVNTQPTDTLGKATPLLSERQLYAAVAKWEAQRNIQKSVAKKQSPSPNVKDMFALIPLKLPGLQVGQTYTEFGGTLQQNNRKYFGPVTIRRLGIKLVSDRGDVVDLNNNDWSVGIICDISVQQRS